ncbi:MAG: hypothetical protein EZS28_032367, partial [Streblomastix strix]
FSEDVESRGVTNRWQML